MKKILALLAVLVTAGAGWATSTVCYGVCPGGPADFKTGTPTITI
jgi:hypothetical protein